MTQTTKPVETNRDKLRCSDLVRAEYRKEMKRVRFLWEQYKTDPEASDENEGTWTEYGLSFDYVAPGTFNDQKRGYFRYQISWGGPSDEFRFYCDERLQITRIEYWYLDWFDGAKVTIRSKRDLAVWAEIWSDWSDCELLTAKLKESQV